MSKSRYPLLNDEQWLRGKYEEEELTSYQIADIVGCCQWAVVSALHRFNIAPRKRFVYKELQDEEWLHQKYEIEELSIEKIANILSCGTGTVWDALKRVGIIRRGHTPKGEKNHNYGKHFSEETKEKMRKAKEGVYNGEKNPFYGKHHTEETKQKLREINNNRSEEIIQKIREARKHQKFPNHHTKPELIFEDFTKKDTLPFRYTGDSSFWIGKGKDALNPDFVHLTKKIVVEIFSWFHDELRNHNVREKARYEVRKKLYKKYGYKMIVFWQEDLEREDAEQFILSVLKKEGVI